jgi:hypothetical protein
LAAQREAGGQRRDRRAVGCACSVRGDAPEGFKLAWRASRGREHVELAVHLEVSQDHRAANVATDVFEDELPRLIELRGRRHHHCTSAASHARRWKSALRIR